jgi:hypothetical protein
MFIYINESRSLASVSHFQFKCVCLSTPIIPFHIHASLAYIASLLSDPFHIESVSFSGDTHYHYQLRPSPLIFFIFPVLFLKE